MKMTKERIYAVCSRTALVLLYVLMADSCFFGGGRTLMIGPVGFRLTLFGLLILTAVPVMLMDLKQLLRNRYMLLLICFGVWLVFSAARGFQNNNNREVLISDLKGYAYFMLLPAGLCLLKTPKQVQMLMKVMMYSAAALALAHVLYLIIYLLGSEWYDILATVGDPRMFSRAGWISEKIPRLFFHSELYLLCGCAFPMFFCALGSGRKWYPLLVGLCLFAILLSYTRSVYLGALIAAAGTILAVCLGCTPARRKNALWKIVASVLVFGVLVAVFTLTQKTNYLGFALQRSSVSMSSEVQESEELEDSAVELSKGDRIELERRNFFLELTRSSDLKRKATFEELKQSIKESPLIGHGLGKPSEIRLQIDGNGYHEYFYLDVLNKMGMIGLLLYMLPVLAMVGTMFRKRNGLSLCKMIWLFCLLGFMTYSWFNPYMNASLGIFMYCCVMCVMCVDEGVSDNGRACMKDG